MKLLSYFYYLSTCNLILDYFLSFTRAKMPINNFYFPLENFFEYFYRSKFFNFSEHLSLLGGLSLLRVVILQVLCWSWQHEQVCPLFPQSFTFLLKLNGKYCFYSTVMGYGHSSLLYNKMAVLLIMQMRFFSDFLFLFLSLADCYKLNLLA